MGIIQYYSILHDQATIVQQRKLLEPEEVFKGRPILSDAIPITLAEYDVKTKDAITAHHLKDYRRKRFNLVLLPEVEVLFDKVLEGSAYWNELLHNENPYTH